MSTAFKKKLAKKASIIYSIYIMESKNLIFLLGQKEGLFAFYIYNEDLSKLFSTAVE